MTIAEAAAQLKVTPGRVRQLIAEGRLKSRLVEVHGLRMKFRAIRQADLDAFVRRPAGRPPTRRPPAPTAIAVPPEAIAFGQALARELGLENVD